MRIPTPPKANKFRLPLIAAALALPLIIGSLAWSLHPALGVLAGGAVLAAAGYAYWRTR